LRPALELPQCRLCCAHVFTKRYERVAAVDLHRFDDSHFRIRQQASAAGKWDKTGASFAHLGIRRAARQPTRRNDGYDQRQVIGDSVGIFEPA
jgi:hypothetical protein